ASLTGHPGGEIGVIEGDEAALPELIRRSHPQVILLNNLFRDQLDRYGELDSIVRLWRTALQTLDSSTTIIVNADDPVLVGLTDDLAARRVCFGLDERVHRLSSLPHAADAATCRNCGAELAYHALYVSHLGDWYCPNCGRKRPPLDYTARDIQLHGGESLALDVVDRDDEVHHLEVGVPGLYNAYNALAAVAAGREMGVPWETVTRALDAFRAAFGRIERITIKGRQITMALVKNPTGFNEVLRMLTAGTGTLEHSTLIAINDRDADGRDISWLWDVDFEMLATGDGALATTGLRGADMANWLKYAGISGDRIHLLPDDLTAALDTFVDDLPEGAHAYLLTSYTAMLALRQTLADRGIVDAFWEQ
ncbi:MAG TPA: MurT ligase domain-containing protein, partial [Thermomicrobiales bacterium]|nr:MurT ligase domain-containing protein [Thermomicrobiales bacterium]